MIFFKKKEKELKKSDNGVVFVDLTDEEDILEQKIPYV